MTATTAPDRFGRYEVVRRLGRGAVGEVFLARDPSLDRYVAVKTLSGLDALSPALKEEARVRFLREARAAAALSHPNIVTVFDVGEEGETPYIAMEYLEGTTLDRHSRPGHLLPPQKVLEIGVQAARALHVAHRAGLVHRDIKPANLVLLGDGKVKVTDFGLAKDPRRSLTSDTTIVGTPYYMSPEQITGREIDGRSDLFSLAVSLYELLTGALPFPGDTVSTVLFRVVNEPPVSFTESRSDLPESIGALLARMLSKGASARLASGAEFAEALAAELTHLGGVARALTLPEPAALRPEKSGSSSVSGRRSARARAATASPSRRGRIVLTLVIVVAVAAVAAWTAPAWIGFDPLGTNRRRAEDWLSAKLGGIGDFVRMTVPDAVVPIFTEPDGLPFLVEPAGIGAVRGNALRIPGGTTGPVTVTVSLPCSVGAETFDADDPPPELRILTKAPEATVAISSRPRGARVELDGDGLEGTTPLEATLRLCEPHSVVLTLPGRPDKEILLAAEGGAATWSEHLAGIELAPPPPGRLVVPAAPYPVRVTLARGGRTLGRAGTTLSLSPGTYRLVLVAPDLLFRREATIRVPSGGSAKLEIEYPPIGRISVRAIPPGGDVSVRPASERSFQSLGETPLNERRVVSGSYELTITHPSMDARITRRIDITSGEPVIVTVGAGDWP